MSGSESDKVNHLNPSELFDELVDRSADELQLLASIYHKRGYEHHAEEIYQSMLKARKDKNERS